MTEPRESAEATDPPEPAGATDPTGAPEAPHAPDAAPGAPATREPRPLLERIGLAALAFVMALLFGFVAAASWVGGELFLTVMAGIGCAMTVWVGAVTLVRG